MCVVSSLTTMHDTLTYCWFNVWPLSATLAHHCTNIGSVYHVCWEQAAYALTL